MKSQHNGPPPEGWRRGVVSGFQTQEDQDLCGAAAAEQPMLKASCEHRTVDLVNEKSTKTGLWNHVYVLVLYCCLL